MKKVILLSLLLLAVVSVFAKPKPHTNGVTIISDKNLVLYFKVSKSFIGGHVEIYDENKTCLETDSLSHTHTMVYFDDAPSGNYTVKVTKGNMATEFKYKKIDY